MSTNINIKAMALDLVVGFLSRLPVQLRSLIGKVLGYLFAFIPTRDRSFARLQLKAAFPKLCTGKLIPGVYASIFQTLFEALNLKPMTDKSGHYISSPDEEFVRELIKANKPVVALTAHTGNWELMAAYMVKLGVPLSTVGRVARNATIHTFLAKLREAYGIKTIWRSKSGGSKVICDEFEKKRVVAALIDQDTYVSSSPAPFFGLKAQTPTGLIALGQRYDATIVTAFNFRVGFNRYKVYVEEVPKDFSPEAIVELYNQRLEAHLKKHPSQWVWFHKRWRTTPEGRRRSSGEYMKFLSELSK